MYEESNNISLLLVAGFRVEALVRFPAFMVVDVELEGVVVLEVGVVDVDIDVNMVEDVVVDDATVLEDGVDVVDDGITVLDDVSVPELITIVLDCPDPVSPNESDTFTLNIQLVVAPVWVD